MKYLVKFDRSPNGLKLVRTNKPPKDVVAEWPEDLPDSLYDCVTVVNGEVHIDHGLVKKKMSKNQNTLVSRIKKAFIA